MLREERLEKIEEYVNLNQYASFSELMEHFNISRATIRRDIEKLEEKKRIATTRGGAFALNRGTMYELPYLEKLKFNSEEKKRIAKAACAHINVGETIFLDSGTTATYITEFISSLPDIYIATNDLMTAVSLVPYPNVTLIMIGGSIRQGFYTACGYFASTGVENYHFDKAFLCADAINMQHGCMITNTDEVDVKRAIVRSSSEVIVLCDHTKFESTAFVSICRPDQIDHVITDTKLDDQLYQSVVDKGITIERV